MWGGCGGLPTCQCGLPVTVTLYSQPPTPGMAFPTAPTPTLVPCMPTYTCALGFRACVACLGAISSQPSSQEEEWSGKEERLLSACACRGDGGQVVLPTYPPDVMPRWWWLPYCMSVFPNMLCVPILLPAGMAFCLPTMNISSSPSRRVVSHPALA